MTAAQAIRDLKKLGDPQRAEHATSYFKASPGEYAEGDRFLGVRVPQIRKLARQYLSMDLAQINTLLESPLHEVRLLGLIILVNQFKQAQAHRRTADMQTIYRFYVAHTEYVNHWDLVDASCRDIVGGYLLHAPKKMRRQLDDWATSGNLWQRRMAIISTWTLIRDGQLNDTIRIGKHLLEDPHDLIHKAVGWMLRDLGGKDMHTLENFLQRYASRMPRTMLRYAIEKMPPSQRRNWLDSTV